VTEKGEVLIGFLVELTIRKLRFIIKDDDRRLFVCLEVEED